jgi:hypothetical protein
VQEIQQALDKRPTSTFQVWQTFLDLDTFWLEKYRDWTIGHHPSNRWLAVEALQPDSMGQAHSIGGLVASWWIVQQTSTHSQAIVYYRSQIYHLIGLQRIHGPRGQDPRHVLDLHATHA